MDLLRRWSMQQLTFLLILIALFEITTSENDLLESFRPKDSNPQELNDFLMNVLEHRKDFSFAREQARKYQKIKKDIQDVNIYDPLDDSMEINGVLKNDYKRKRHVQHYNFRKRIKDSDWKNLHKLEIKRLRREIEKRQPKIIIINEAERKTLRPKETLKNRMPRKFGEKHLPSEIYRQPEIGKLVNRRAPQDIEVKPNADTGVLKERREKKQTDFSSSVHKTYKSHPFKNIALPPEKDQKYLTINLEDAAKKDQEKYEDKKKLNLVPDHRLYPDRVKSQSMDYQEYGGNPQNTLEDDVAFERALSYEMEPRPDNNPYGNNLYSVDAGRPDAIIPLRPEEKLANNDFFRQDPSAITDESFLFDKYENMRRIETTSLEPAYRNQKPISLEVKHYVEQIGDGFVDIAKPKRQEADVEDEENNFQVRKLQFIDYEEPNFYSNYEDVKELPYRSRRDFLDALGMKNEEDYSEDNPYVEEINVNNTDVRNDTHIHNETCGRIETTTKCHKKEKDLEEMKHILQEPRELSDDIVSGFKSAKKHKKHKEKRFSHNTFDDKPVNMENDIETKMLANTHNNFDDKPLNVEHQLEIKILANKDKEKRFSHNTFDDKTANMENDIETKMLSNTNNNFNDKPLNVEHELETKILANKDQDKRFSHNTFDDKTVNMENDIETKVLANTNNNIDDKPLNVEHELETKVLANKDKLSRYEDKTRHNFNELLPIRQPMVHEVPEVEFYHNINKKQNEKTYFAETNPAIEFETADGTESTETETIAEDTTIISLSEIDKAAVEVTNLTESDTIIHHPYDKIALQIDEENEKLAQVVNGRLASKIVSTVFNDLKMKTSLKAKFYSGLSRKHVNFAGTIDFDIFKSNETEDADEARFLLSQITKVLNRLVINQVRRKLCQRLPEELKDYLDIVLNVKLTPEPPHFEPNTQQGKFLFKYQEKTENPFNLVKLEDTLIKLEGLLLTYHNMNEDCKNEAEPVKNYIEKHVKMLKQIVQCPNHKCEEQLAQTKRDSPSIPDDLAEKELESVGLGKDNDVRSWRRYQKRDVRDVKRAREAKSEKFRKLELAVEKIRQKRENDKKIAELFGVKKKRSLHKVVGYEKPVVYAIG